MLPPLDAPEIVIGICSPIGADNSKVWQIIQDQLRAYNYSAEKFKVTDLMKDLVPKGIDLVDTPTEARYDSYIRYANKLRELYDAPGTLAMVCCAALRGVRRDKAGAPNTYLPGNAYVFDQFKRPEEIELLRQVYGRLFILISVYSDKEKRTERLAKKISDSHSSARIQAVHRTEARSLVQRDEDEEGEAHGQRMRDAFALADVFINIDDEKEAEEVVVRFMQSFFGANFNSPTPEEYGMYMAKSASLRSLDLSRQVGAAIFSPQGEVITLGCNEVPKAGGGTYWCTDEEDHRDYTYKVDENERIKQALVTDLVKRLFRDPNFIKDRKTEREIVAYVKEQLTIKGSPLREAQAMDLLEFGRAIHAEMSAISDAARLGRSVAHSVLYCTTFPCHMCAKHIVGAGIDKVVYIEPYPKSYAVDLLECIVVQTGPAKRGTVQFSPFIGVSPYRYRDLFERTRRKDKEGKFLDWIEGKARPIVRYTIATYLYNEEALFNRFDDKSRELIEKGLIEIRRR
jgi:deoxycytidylate deaminase